MISLQTAGWNDPEELFGSQGSKAIRCYREFMEEGKGEGKREDLVGGGWIRGAGEWPRVLGLRERGEDMAHDPRVRWRGDCVDVWTEAKAGVKRQLMGGERRDAVQQVIKEFRDKAGIREEELRRGQQRQVSDLRREIAYPLSREVGVAMAETGRQAEGSASAAAKTIQKTDD